MTVQELRETLTQLVRLLDAADARKGTLTTGLTEFVEATAQVRGPDLRPSSSWPSTPEPSRRHRRLGGAPPRWTRQRSPPK